MSQHLIQLTGVSEVTVWRWQGEVMGSRTLVDAGRVIQAPFRLTASANGRIRFTDYPADVVDGETPRRVTHTLSEMAVTEPVYGTGKDGSGRPYETVSWFGSLIAWADAGRGALVEVQVQTWDRITVFVWARYPDRRQSRLVCVTPIAALDERSQTALAALLDRLNPDRPPTPPAGPAQLALL